METLQQLIPLALRTSLLLIVFAIGLDATFHDAAYLLKRPKLLLRSLAAIAVIVPAFAALMIAAFPLTPVVKAGIVLMAVSPFPPIVPGKEIKMGGRESYVYGLLVAVSILAIVTVPLTVALLGAVFSKNVAISPGAVARLVLISVILPLAIGMAVRRIAPFLAKRMGPIISTFANITLIIGVLPLLIMVWPAILHLLGNGTILAIIAVVVVGFLAGHLLGGPDPRDRAVLAISSASRHPGIALLIAGVNFPEPGVKAAILLFLIVGLIVSIPYQIWCKRRYPVLGGATHAAGKTD
jgi:BASS family bile acid:Na+ symporter